MSLAQLCRDATDHLWQQYCEGLLPFALLVPFVLADVRNLTMNRQRSSNRSRGAVVRFAVGAFLGTAFAGALPTAGELCLLVPNALLVDVLCGGRMGLVMLVGVWQCVVLCKASSDVHLWHTRVCRHWAAISTPPNDVHLLVCTPLFLLPCGGLAHLFLCYLQRC